MPVNPLMVRAVLVIPVPLGKDPSRVTLGSATRQTRRPDEVMVTSPSAPFSTPFIRGHQPTHDQALKWGPAAGVMALAEAESQALRGKTVLVLWRNGRAYHKRAFEDALAGVRFAPTSIVTLHGEDRDGRTLGPGESATRAARGQATFGVAAEADTLVRAAASLPQGGGPAGRTWEKDLLVARPEVPLVLPPMSTLPSKAPYSRSLGLTTR